MRVAGNATAILCVILLGGCVCQPGAGEAGGAVWHGEAGGHAGGYHRRGFPPWGGSGPLPSGTTWQSDGPIEPLAEAGSEQAEMAVPEEATPDMLFEAAVVGSSWEVERLLDMGVNPDSFNHDGETAMMLAAMHDHDSVVKVLLRKGADVLHKDLDGRTPLIAAATLGRGKAVSALLESTAYASPGGTAVRAKGSVLPINGVDSEGRTALLLACLMGHHAVVRALLDGAPDIEMEARDRNGRTPLMWAVTSSAGGLATVELLLERGASTLAEDSNGATPLDWAFEKGDQKVIEAVAKNRYPDVETEVYLK